MGIYKLMELIREHANGAIRQRDPKYYQGNTVACDASMTMYQFLIAGQGYD
jgi:flap endonuclease-1